MLLPVGFFYFDGLFCPCANLFESASGGGAVTAGACAGSGLLTVTIGSASGGGTVAIGPFAGSGLLTCTCPSADGSLTVAIGASASNCALTPSLLL